MNKKKKKVYAKDDPDKPLSKMEQKFVEAYAGNGEQAAIIAGYSKKTARMQASRLLTRANVIKAIKARQEEPRALRILTRQERQNFWTKVALGEEEGADMKDRLKATELLGRSEADFTDKLNLSGRPTVIVKDLTGESKD